MVLRALFPALLAALLAVPMMAQAMVLQTKRGPVEIAAIPQRVVVFDMAALDTLQALGVAVVGAPGKLYVDFLDRGDAAPVGTLFEPDLAAVAALQPDLIIIGGRSARQYDALAAIAPVVDMTMPVDVTTGAGDRLTAYGALFGRQDRAAELLAAYQAKRAAVTARAAGKGTALVVLASGAKLSAHGVGARFGWLHDTLGLTQARDGLRADMQGEPITPEFIADADPDWLIVIDRAVAIGAEAREGRAQATLDIPAVTGSRAVQGGRVVYLTPAPIYIGAGGYRQMMGTLDEMLAALARAG